MYAYGPSPSFPSYVEGDNYWVDVVFNDTSQRAASQRRQRVRYDRVQLGSLDPSVGAARQRHGPQGTAACLFTGVSNPGQWHGDLSFEHADREPSCQRTGLRRVGPVSPYTITDGQSTGQSTGSGNVSLTVNYPVTAQSLFYNSDTPAMVAVNDPNSVELGV